MATANIFAICAGNVKLCSDSQTASAFWLQHAAVAAVAALFVILTVANVVVVGVVAALH